MQEYKQFNRFCKLRKSLEHKYLLPLMHYYAIESEDYTIKSWKFQLMFEYPNNDLKLELRFRIIHDLRFTIGELRKIAKGKESNRKELSLHFITCSRMGIPLILIYSFSIFYFSKRGKSIR